ncbi:MAG: efflux RND transporter periplasmic adaptor subunit [Chitinophagaceae bacterium]
MKYSFILFVASASFIVSCGSHNQAENKITKEQPISVNIQKPQSTNNQATEISGTVEAVQTAAISTRVMGYITSIKVKEGDRVAAGEVLATINAQDFIAKKAQAEAQIAEAAAHVKSAQKDYDRFMALFQQQSATQKEVDNITLQVQSAKARLEAANQMKVEVTAMMQYTQLTAPFNGVVVQKMAEQGSLATPGMPVLVIEQAGAFQISAGVPESAIPAISLGKKVNVTIKSTTKSFTGTISQINPSATFSGGQYIIKINIPATAQSNLYNGMYVNVSIPGVKANISAEEIGIAVPESALVYQDQLVGIYTVSANNTALLRWLRIGKKENGQQFILSGLAENEAFIASANGKLYNGAPVKITNQ